MVLRATARETTAEREDKSAPVYSADWRDEKYPNVSESALGFIGGTFRLCRSLRAKGIHASCSGSREAMHKGGFIEWGGGGLSKGAR
jgi:hypothetical protein